MPEGRGIFPGLSVIDNLRLGATPRRVSRTEIERDVVDAAGAHSQRDFGAVGPTPRTMPRRCISSTTTS